jgi:hypothetical protein
VLVIGFMVGLDPLANYDTWWHLAGGRYIVEQGAITHTDPFSFTMNGREWVMHEWGWDLLIFYLYAWFGPLGVILLRACVSALIFLSLYYLALRRGASAFIALLVTLLATQAIGIWINERPQVLQPLFILCALHLMHSYRQGKGRAMLLYPVLMVLWVNFHGSFPFGLVLLVLFVGCELLRVQKLGLRRALPVLVSRPSIFLFGVILLAVIACFLGPNGARGAMYPLDYVNGKLAWAVEAVQEWKSPDWHHSYMRPIELTILFTFLAMALSPMSPAPFDLLSVLMGVHMLLQWGRNGPLFATLASPVLAVHLSAWTDTVLLGGRSLERELDGRGGHRELPMRVASWVVILALAVLMLTRVPWNGQMNRLIKLDQYPVKAAEVVALNKVKGHMWNVYHWGGYLVWRFYKERPVFIDGRADVYGKAIWDDYQKISQGRSGWREMLDKWDVQYLLIDSSYGMCRTLDLAPDFVRIYTDSRASVYVRDSKVNADVLARYRAGKLIVPKTDLPDLNAFLYR